MMKPQRVCRHKRTTFHSIQQLGNQPPVELRQCVRCHTTLSVEMTDPAVAATVAASH